MYSELLNFEKLLTSCGYECEMIRKGDNMPYDCLKFFIGNDKHGRPLHLTLNIIENQMNIPLQDGGNRHINIELFVQMITALPFRIKEGHIGETARILLFFNKSLDIPGFGLDEVSKTIFYRYTFIKPNSVINKETFIAMIGMIRLVLDAFSDAIEEVANGGSLKETISRILQ